MRGLEELAALYRDAEPYADVIRREIAGKKSVIYGAGNLFNCTIQHWRRGVGSDPDFVCDRDKEKHGRSILGVPCISPDELLAMKNEAAVFLSLAAFHRPLAWMTANNIKPRLLHSLDYEASADAIAMGERRFLAAVSEFCEAVEDGHSRVVLLTALRRILTANKDPYFMRRVALGVDSYFTEPFMRPLPDDILVDLGAYDGDTVRDFIARSGGNFRRIYSYEMDPENYRRLVETNSDERVEAFMLAVGSDERTVLCSHYGGASAIGYGENAAQQVSLDSHLAGKPYTILKADIEGAEMDALRGAALGIAKNRPRAAVCVYHKLSHLWEIPLFFKGLGDYRVYLRQHSLLGPDTVCYAAPRSKGDGSSARATTWQ